MSVEVYLYPSKGKIILYISNIFGTPQVSVKGLFIRSETVKHQHLQAVVTQLMKLTSQAHIYKSWEYGILLGPPLIQRNCVGILEDYDPSEYFLRGLFDLWLQSIGLF